ncbi:hypothetical protein DL93DRAFT_2103003 [Clavulina sp. PMI_390]|nr:hypothetical protein DL93DRAFT_2103003 [Clavulina sp. PMI_390]
MSVTIIENWGQFQQVVRVAFHRARHVTHAHCSFGGLQTLQASSHGVSIILLWASWAERSESLKAELWPTALGSLHLSYYTLDIDVCEGFTENYGSLYHEVPKDSSKVPALVVFEAGQWKGQLECATVDGLHQLAQSYRPVEPHIISIGPNLSLV